MSSSVDRRQFVVLSAATGLAVGLPAVAEAAGAVPAFAQTFVHIAPDSTVTVLSKHLDMGQGIWSGLSSIVAEEMDASWAQMRVEGAPAAPEYKHLMFGSQVTGGSTSIANSWTQYRTAGATARAMLLQAAAQRWSVPAGELVVSEGVISHASGRKARFGDLAAAAAALPAPTDAPLKDPKTFKYLGHAWPRMDSESKTLAKAQYGIDVQLPGMKIAVLQRPPRFGGKVVSVDAAAAKAIPGVVDVVTTPSGVAVIADDTWTATRGRDALKIKWDETGCETRSSQQITEEYRKMAREPGGLVCAERGHVDTAMAAAAKTVEAEYSFPYLAHAPMEPLTSVCHHTAEGCELWGGFQAQTANQAAIAKIFGLPIEKVKLNTLYAGGSFGRRASATSDWVAELGEIVFAAKADYPIKLTWTREDDIRGGYYRPLTLHRMKAGLDKAGNVIAADQVIVTQSFFFGGPYGNPALTKVDPTAHIGSFVELYATPDAKLRWMSTRVQVPVYTFRAVSNNHTAFAKEVFMDELALAAGRDPLEFRLAHLAHAPRQAAVLKLAAEKAGWGKPVAAGRALGLAVHESDKSFVAQVAEVSVTDGEVKVHKVVCAIDCGFALNPDNVRSQMEGGIIFALGIALHGEILLTDGKVEQSNFHDYQSIRMNEAPAIEVHILESTAAPTGVGEPGTTPTAAAVGNALAKLTGKPVRSQPFVIAEQAASPAAPAKSPA